MFRIYDIMESLNLIQDVTLYSRYVCGSRKCFYFVAFVIISCVHTIFLLTGTGTKVWMTGPQQAFIRIC